MGRLGSGMRVNASFQIIPSSVDGSVRIKVRVRTLRRRSVRVRNASFQLRYRSLYVDWL